MDQSDPQSAEIADAQLQSFTEGQHAKRESSRDITMSLVSSEILSGDYGACGPDATENFQLIPDTELCPMKVFLKRWISVSPIVGPLFLMVVLNALKPGDLLLQCESLENIAARSLCTITAPSVKFFPTLGFTLCVLLLVWCVEHERAYYVMMRHKIMVDLQVGQRFAFWTTATLSFFFLAACLHMALKFFAGHPCAEDFSAKTDNDPCNHQYLLVSSFSELLRNPGVLDDPRNRLARDFLHRALIKFVTPGIVALVCLFGMLSLEDELLPLSKMLEDHPCRKYKDMGDCVYIQEPILRILISRGEDMRRSKESCTIEELLTEIREAALAAGCRALNSDPEVPSIDILSQLRTPKGQKSINGSIDRDLTEVSEDSLIGSIVPSRLLGLFELLNVEWWPVALLVRPNLIDSTSTLFRIISAAHFLAAFLGCGVMIGFIIRRIILDSLLVVNDYDHYYTLPFMICALFFELGLMLSWMLQTWRIGFATCSSYLSNPSDTPVTDENVATA